MSHEIDQSAGKAAIAFAHEVPWHGLGTNIDPQASLEEWQKAGGLEFEYLTTEVKFSLPGDLQLLNVFEGRNVVFRSDTHEPMSVVSDRYKPVHPKQVLEFFRNLVGELGAFEMETVGSLRNGRKIWALARAKDSIKLSKTDVLERYLLLATSCDLSLPTLCQQTSTRVVCANTLAAATMGGAKHQFRTSHITQFNGDKVKQKMALDEGWKDFAKAVNLLAGLNVDGEAVSKFFMDVFFPEPIRQSKEFSEKGATKRVNELTGIFHQAPGQNLKTAKGTAWGLLNAVTYFVDHQAKSASADARLDKAWFGDGNVLKTRATQRAYALAGV